MFSNKKEPLVIEDIFPKTVLNAPMDPQVHELYDKTIRNIYNDLDHWYKQEYAISQKTSGLVMKNFFYQELRNVNTDTLFKLERRNEFIRLFDKKEDSPNTPGIMRFFSLIDTIYLVYPLDILYAISKKFLYNIQLKEKSTEGSNTYKETQELMVDLGCYWIWVLPMYRHVTLYKPMISTVPI